jgi:hypothetical protein
MIIEVLGMHGHVLNENALTPLPAGSKSKAMTSRVMHAFTGTILMVLYNSCVKITWYIFNRD